MSELRKPYHHRQLPEALVAAAIELIEERGVEFLSVRDVARRVGVSPAAPFRHFKSREALLTAVAVQAMLRLRASIDAALAAHAPQEPVAVLEAIGFAYLDWAANNPTHFQIISSRKLIDFDGTPALVESNTHLRQLLATHITEAKTRGQVADTLNDDILLLSMRAFAYGLARMHCDGQIPNWHGPEPPHEATLLAIRQYFTMLRKPSAG
jgi:AcrR family transcriptional regulator